MRGESRDGIEVVVDTPLEELPDRASKVVFSDHVINDGDGPRLCMGFAVDTRPPACLRQPVLNGFDPDSWPDEESGVRWGGWDVTVSWPIQDGHLDTFDISTNTRFRIQSPQVLPS